MVPAPRLALLALLVSTTGGFGSACGLNQQGVSPPADAISFPSSAVIEPGGRWLVVANGNSDLRYNDGTLVAVDLAKVDINQTRPWELCPQVGYVHPVSAASHDFCCWDRLDRQVLNCDERPYLPAAATVKIGSFASGMVWQSLCDPTAAEGTRAKSCQKACDGTGPRGRIFLGVRGNSSLTYVDVDVAAEADEPRKLFTCGDDDAPFRECGGSHELLKTTTASSGAASLPDEPYALALDPDRQLLYVGHLKGDIAHPDTGGISLFDVAAPTTPQFLSIMGSIFPADGNGFFGVTSLMPHDIAGSKTAGEVFATSRYVPRVGSFLPTTVTSCDQQPTSLQDTVTVPGGDVLDTTLIGSETRGIRFVDDAHRAFVLQRVPPALVGFDVAPDPDHGTRFMPSEVLETCSGPTFLDAHRPGNAGWQLYVTCFDAGQVYVFDPYTPRLVTVVDVGRGPAGLVFGPSPGDDLGQPETWTRAYVIGFGANDLGVLDLRPSSDTQYHVIQHIGFPSVVPR